jgi:tetratricopeptide (TPR) repeat protein
MKTPVRTALTDLHPSIGRRVRALRQARRMTQSELAAGEFSKGFISLVETGRTGLSVRAATVIAKRLGVEISDLLVPGEESGLELDIVRAEALLARGDHEAAREAAEALLEGAHGIGRGRVHRLIGRAASVASPNDAIRELDEAVRIFRERGDRELAIRTSLDLAEAHLRAGLPTEALTLALDCEHSLRAVEIVDRTFELRVAQFLSGVFVTLGDLRAAESRAARALAIAQDIDDTVALAQLYLSMSSTREEAGDFEAAMRYARKSLDLSEAIGARVEVARVWQNIGWLHLRRGRLERADEAITKAEGIARETHNERLLAHALTTRAEIAEARRDFAEAVRLAERASAAPAAGRRTVAVAKLIRARAIAASGALLAEVRAAFDEAVTAAEGFAPRTRGDAHAEYARALEARGEMTEALRESKLSFGALREQLR